MKKKLTFVDKNVIQNNIQLGKGKRIVYMSSQDMEGTSNQGQQLVTNFDKLVTKQFNNKDVNVYGMYQDPLFNAKQVCTILGIKSSKKAIQDFRENEKVQQPNKSLTGLKSQWFLRELGLLKLMMKQDNEIAQQFQEWVFEWLKELRQIHYQSVQNVGQSDDDQDNQLTDSITKQFNDLEISIYGTKEEPLFDPKQVAKILDIKDVNSSIRNFTNQQKSMQQVHTKYGDRQAYLLKEFGLYELIFVSRKPQAQQFKFWVFNVIREIRLTGQYRLQDSNKQLLIENQQFKEDINKYEVENQKYLEENQKYQEENQKYQDEIKKFQEGNPQLLLNDIPGVQKNTFESKEYNQKVSVFKIKDEKKDIYYVGEQDQMDELEEVYTKSCIDGELCEKIIKSMLKQQDVYYARYGFVMCKLDHIRLMMDYVCNQINVLIQCREDIKEEELIRRLKNEFGQKLESITEEERIDNEETDNENVVDQEEDVNNKDETEEEGTSNKEEETENSDVERKDQEAEKWEKVSVSGGENKEDEGSVSTSRDVRVSESTVKDLYKWIPRKMEYKKGIAVYCDDIKQVFQEETGNKIGKTSFRKVLQEYFEKYTDNYIGQLRLRVSGSRLQKNALHNVRFMEDGLNRYNYPYSLARNKE